MILWVVGLLSFVCTFAWAETEKLEDSKDWKAFRFVEGGQKTCYASSLPLESKGKYTRRGDVVVYVSHFLEKSSVGGVFDQVSLDMGYPVRDKSDVRLKVGKREYIFATSKHSDDKSTVYMVKNEEKALIKDFKKGYDFEVRGVSSRGTKTYDKYSLRGFTKVYASIGKGCPRDS